MTLLNLKYYIEDKSQINQVFTICVSNPCNYKPKGATSGREGRDVSPAFFKKFDKKCPDLGKQCPDCVYLWVKILI